MSSPLNGFGHRHGCHDKEEDDKEELYLELSLSSTSPCCTPPTSTSMSSIMSTVSVCAESPPPLFISSPPPPTYHNHFAASIPPPPPPHNYTMRSSQEIGSVAPSSRPTTLRTRRSPVQTLKPGKTETIPAPFPWATTKRATIYSLDYLLSNQIGIIGGGVQCKRCDKMYQMEYDLREKFVEIATFIAENKSAMHDRAPAVWMNPNLPNCRFCCQNNCVRPFIDKKKTINWLFLLLGQMLGCCKLDQLKYFCKHTKNHRTGAKDRVLYLTYLGLCKQLDPTGPFDA
ncbi:hypothetical protein ACOSP7_029848 [Xanthoceras sorbifolium]|uniref:DUF7086 domain-containing protein n=1 Tax=Xanthoceras sorbifolium TaxID=99658 RepID=A0ABQ8HAC7_9ROSI|nr:hypothetical protein JRO89_XS12G0011900 [Xanthoceras sorbifolium]